MHRILHTVLTVFACLLMSGPAPVPPITGAEPAPGPSLRIVSYNIKHGRGMDGQVDVARIAKVIAALEPDLVALQEVDENCTRSGKQDTAAELGRLLGMHHRFAKFMDYQGGAYGLAVLSRLPIASSTRIPQPDGAEPRSALEVQVQVTAAASPLSFVCVHHDWTNEAFRLAQMDALLTALRDRPHPVIIAGDFNGERTDASMKRLEHDGWTILEKDDAKAANTFPSEDPRKEIDYVVVRNLPKATIRHDVIDERIASDHRPIRATITFD